LKLPNEALLRGAEGKRGRRESFGSTSRFGREGGRDRRSGNCGSMSKAGLGKLDSKTRKGKQQREEDRSSSLRWKLTSGEGPLRQCVKTRRGLWRGPLTKNKPHDVKKRRGKIGADVSWSGVTVQKSLTRN